MTAGDPLWFVLILHLAPTIAELAGVTPAPDWQGRSLFDPDRSPRAYFYVAEDEFTLGVRESNWKYIFNLRDGTEALYDLDREAMQTCREIGLPMARAQTVNDDPIFLDMMADVVLRTIRRYQTGRPLPIVSRA